MSQSAERKGAETRLNLAEMPAALTSDPTGIKAHARDIRRSRQRRLARLLVIFVLLPTALAAAYFGAIATPQYESYAVFSVHSSELKPTLGIEGLLSGVINGSASTDTLAVREFILSRDMLTLLNKEHALLEHYKAKRNDVASRLRASATFEEAYEYYGSKVSADYDQATGHLTLRVRAFDGPKARDYARSILAHSEEMVNKLSERERTDATRHAQTDVGIAEQRLKKARSAILALQQQHSDFSPLHSAESAMQVRTHLHGELAVARAELLQLKSFMQEGTPQVQAATEKVKALAAQVASESQRLVNPSTSSKGLNSSFADFEAAMVEKEFSQKAYESALASFELAKANAARQHRYLARIAGPSLPDSPTYPRRLRSVISTFVLSFVLLGIVSLLGAAAREHARL